MVTLLRSTPDTYGAAELNTLYRAHTTKGFILALCFHLVAVGVYAFALYLTPVEAPRILNLGPDIKLAPPPSIINSPALPSIMIAGQLLKPNAGTPVPVPDFDVSPEQTIPTQRQLSDMPGPALENSARPGDIVIEPPAEGDDTPPPSFRPVEKFPQAIKQVKPVYPEIARRAGIEGTVWVNLWIDKEGSIRKGLVVKTDSEIFNQSALDAAMQWRFTPAIMNSGPVAVWISIPIRFRLSDKH